jgi:hypothetical protein
MPRAGVLRGVPPLLEGFLPCAKKKTWRRQSRSSSQKLVSQGGSSEHKPSIYWLVGMIIYGTPWRMPSRQAIAVTIMSTYSLSIIFDSASLAASCMHHRGGYHVTELIQVQPIQGFCTYSAIIQVSTRRCLDRKGSRVGKPAEELLSILLDTLPEANPNGPGAN